MLKLSNHAHCYTQLARLMWYVDEGAILLPNKHPLSNKGHLSNKCPQPHPKKKKNATPKSYLIEKSDIEDIDQEPALRYNYSKLLIMQTIDTVVLTVPAVVLTM